MTDCLIVGFNDVDFASYVSDVRLMGADSGAFRDLRLAYIDLDGRPLRALDALSHLRESPPGAPKPYFHNADFLWPVVTVLGSFLARRGLSVDFVNLFQHEREQLREKLDGDVRLVAITTTLYVSPQPIIEIVEFVRRHNPKVSIVVGGPFITNQVAALKRPDLDALMDYLGADYYVTGREGELTLARLALALRSGTDPGDVPNLAYRSDGDFVHTRTEIESNPLHELVDYQVFGPDAFNEFVTTRTAKSCPFSCAFCGFPQRAGKYTYLDVTHVERELDNIRKLPSVNTVTFIDDTFNVPKNRFRDILRMMIDKDYGFKWNCFYRSDHGDRATIELMKEAGCEGVFLGIESGSDMLLKQMNKTARRADYIDALGAFNEHGISTYASLIVGFPGETEETVAETVDLLDQGRPDYFRAQLWYCDPVTPIYQRRDELGIKGEAFNWSHQTMDWSTAAQIIDDLFVDVTSSVWLPQFGFEQWSTFYLQRKGMSGEQVKDFVRAFNGVLADQLRHSGGSAAQPELLDRLRRASQFEAVNPPGPAPSPVS
ncbi:PhpK family radical SAM P-methyltransferase [Micromonospora sp. NPDC047465]|uniref:PhpK family radical SAM P-methyltransferase n=1 Tax=Micromonospora sp. NPDC047465 TaxID=3154813 RepID=UPI0033CCD440